MWRGCLLVIALTVFTTRMEALDPQAALSQMAHQTWRTENGLPQNTVHAILQTRDGYLWLATEGGVVRFDGVRFVVYDRQNTPELNSNNIRALAEGRDGSLWIASADGLLRFKGGERESYTTDQGLPTNNVWAVHVNRDGAVWAATTDGLARQENDRFRRVEMNSGVVSAFSEGRRGSFWIATDDGIKIFENGRLNDALQQPVAAKRDTDMLLADSAGRLWLGTSKGLVAESGVTSTLYTIRDGLPSNRITALYEDRQGTIWIGTDAGAVRIREGKIARFPANDGLAGEMILSFYEDREGDLWAGTESNGVTILREQKFTTYTDAQRAAQDMVRCVFEDDHGVVWMGTGGQGLRRFAGGRFSAISTKDGLSSDQIFALAQDANGDLLVGTPDGLNRIHDGKVLVLTSADGLADDFVRSIFRDRDGSLWIGTRRGLSHFKDGRFETYTQRDGLGSDLVGAILRARDGALWIGTLRGLSRLENGRIENFTTKNGLTSDVITALYEDGEGSLWIGTEEGGLNLYSRGKFSSFGARGGLPETIYGITDDANGNLWMPASTGVYRADARELKRLAGTRTGDATVVSYGTGDGLRVSECTGGGHPAVWKGMDGLWFATPKGAALLTSEEARTNDVAPPVAIESVSVNDRSYDPAQLREIRPGPSRFSFEYAGLSFLAPQKVLFRYKLDGFDREWIDAGTRRVAYYTNIPAGNYRFRVLARNNDGVWNERGASFEFKLLPHFYRTYWFAALMLALLCVLGYGTYRWRVREVEARFNAVLAERNRIAREIHDTLAQGFVAVSVQLELVSRLLSSSTESAKEHLNQARVLVRDSLAEARSAIWELRSQSPENADLASRLSKMAAQVTATSKAKARVEIHGTYRPLGSSMEDQLVRIGQEAVTNAVRHADAENIAIQLVFEPKKIRMTIADDGRGFTMEANGRGPIGHFGLQGMRERAERIKAELKVDSKLGEGTRVSLEATAG